MWRKIDKYEVWVEYDGFSHLDDIISPVFPIENDLLSNLSRHLRTSFSHMKIVNKYFKPS